MCEWRSCGLLKDAESYQPDTLDLNRDTLAAEYWFPCFRNMIEKFTLQAAASQKENYDSAVERSEQFRVAYLQKLDEYQRNIEVNLKNKVVLGIRELLELNETQLRRFGFPDPWLEQKQMENTAAMALLESRLHEIDSIDNMDARWTELVRGVLAGNMFDWGAEAIARILEKDENFGLHAALERMQKRPWLIDNLDNWLLRLKGEAHKCAVIFVDNSGIDILLGILPFARELLKQGTKVFLCANTEPSLNDVTSNELKALLRCCICHCAVLAEAWACKRLCVYESGQRGPCLDIRTLPTELCEAIRTNETDLLVIEGMGRAIHTNLYAKFNCETLKLAVIKNKWLAQHLGGEMFAIVCKYER